MAEREERDHTQLPTFLEGLELPATVEDVLEHAEARGASERVLAYLETLPAAVFTSEVGLRHAFTHFREEELPEIDAVSVLVGQDGTSS